VEVWENVSALLAELDVLLGFAELAVNAPTPYVRPTMLPTDAGEIVLTGVLTTGALLSASRAQDAWPASVAASMNMIRVIDVRSRLRACTTGERAVPDRVPCTLASSTQAAGVEQHRPRHGIASSAGLDWCVCRQPASECGGAGGRRVYPQRLPPSARRVVVPDYHRTEHGRQVHIHPPGKFADCRANSHLALLLRVTVVRTRTVAVALIGAFFGT
jgi:hypothetical protein